MSGCAGLSQGSSAVICARRGGMMGAPCLETKRSYEAERSGRAFVAGRQLERKVSPVMPLTTAPPERIYTV
jgi:hypothetical protein